MKKVLLAVFTFTLLNFIPFSSAKAQGAGTIDLFCEDFNTLPWGMTTYGIPVNISRGFVPESLVTRMASAFSATDTIVTNSVAVRASSYIQTPNLGIAGFTSLGVQFDHICYLEQFDEMSLQVSFDGGANWQRCGANLYKGSSGFLPGNYFNKTSRPVQWKFAPTNDTTFVWNNFNAAWITEDFDITPLVNATLPTPDSAMFRIELLDGGQVGRVGTHRYYLENFCVRGSNCELIPPTVALDDPPANYPSRYEDRVYWQGPYDFNAQLIDASTIDTAYVDYYIRREIGGTMTTIGPSGVELVRVGNTSFYNGEIPASAVQIGDSVYWRLIAVDGSPCRNTTQEPANRWEAFQVRSNLPKSCRTQPIFNYPYVEDFNSGQWVPGLSGVLANDWTNVQGDFHNWWVNSGGTTTAGTGPTDDIPGGGKYLLLEATGYPDSSAFLLSPCVDLFELPNALVRFYLHQNTTGGDTVFVDAFDPQPLPGFPDGKFINNIVPPISGNKGDNWLPYEFTTYALRNKVTQFRFRGVPDKLSDLSDVGLDSFKIVYSALEDMRADRVVLPPFMPENETYPVNVGIQNQGVNPVSSLLLNFDVFLASNNSIIDSARDVPWTATGGVQPIAPGEFRIIEIPGETYMVPRGQYFIRAWLEYSPDEVLPNDTTVQGTRGLAYKQIYYRDFFDDDDSAFTALVSDADTLFNFWQYGEPNYDKTNRAFTLPNAWDVNLDRPYIGVGNSIQLLSPFMDFSNAQDVFLSFFNNRDIDTAKDGVYLQYSLDQGITWDSVPAVQDPGRLKWYNSFLADPSFGGQPVFSDVTRYIPLNWYNWIESEIMLPPVFDNEPLVLLRFVFFAEDANQANDGMSIDNFLVYDRKPIDVEPQFIMKPDPECDMTTTEKFFVCFKNRGETTITSFDAEFVVTHNETGVTQRFTETINRTIQPRDTIYHRSVSLFDMTTLGDYTVSVITKLPGDGYAINDTLRKPVENIPGCYLTFEAITGAYKRRARVDSSFWRFEYTSDNGRSYVVTDDYQPFNETDTNRLDICIRRNSFVKFSLGDVDTAIVSYSLYAYDGEKDTVLVNQSVGGTDTPTRFFNWVCPPDSSARTIEILIDNNRQQLPIAKQYSFSTVINNNGLDSIATLEVGLSIDGSRIFRRNETFTPPMEYNEDDTISFGFQFLGPGRHTICGWTYSPNGNMDELPEDDTICRPFVVIDTANLGATRLDSLGNPIQVDPQTVYCTDFENPDDSLTWIGLNFVTTYQDETVSFDWATPNTTNLNSAYTGTKAWVTAPDTLYENFDNSALLSPFIKLQRDSCYRLSFYQNYVFDDLFHDGSQVRITTDTGHTWNTINGKMIGVGDTALQVGWYNTTNIVAIPDNDQNAGWTGRSNGWVKAQSVIPGYEDAWALIAFRFGADGNGVGEGWAIDNFCLERISTDVSQQCFAVGLNEEEIDPNQFYLGQNQPNPAMNNTQVPFYLPRSGQVNFTVTNMMGQTVYEDVTTRASGNHLMKLDISNYESGVYYYWIVFEDVKIARKMIITR